MRDTLIRSACVTCVLMAAGAANVRAAPAANAAAKPGAVAPNRDVRNLLASATLWHSRHRNDLARAALEKALLVQPDQPDALSLLGQIEIEENQPQAANRALQTLRARYPNSPATKALADVIRINTVDKSRIARARLLQRSGQADAAFAEYRALFPDGPPNGDLGVEYYRAQANATNGWPAAQQGLAALSKASPEDSRASQSLAELMIDRPASRLAGTRMVADLAARPNADLNALLSLWQKGLAKADGNLAWLPLYQRYLALAPNDADTRAAYDKLNAQQAARTRMLNDPAYKARQAGIRALDQGRLSDAEKSLDAARVKRPNDGELLGSLGLVKMRQGDHEGAQALFAQALRKDPDNAGKWRSLLKTSQFWGAMAQARAARDAGRLSDADRLVRGALASDPNNPDGLALLGDIALDDKREDDAERLFRQALKIEPDNDTALRGMITLYSRQQRRTELANLLGDLRRRFPQDKARFDKAEAAALSDDADRAIAQGHNGPALAALERAVALDPGNAWTRYSLASLYRKLRLAQIGREVMAEGARQTLTPEDRAQMLYAQAIYLNVIDDEAGARESLAQIPAASATPSIRRLQTTLAIRDMARLAREAHAAGNDDESERRYGQALAMAGDDPELIGEVARARVSAGQPDQGLALMRDWLAAHAGKPQPDAQLRYAELLNTAERDTELGTFLASMDPASLGTDQRDEWQDLQDRLALRQADRARALGDFSSARQTLEPLLSRQPPDSRALSALGDIYFDERRYDDARKIAEDQIRQDPANQDARLSLVRVLYEMQDDKAANRELDRALAEASPDDVWTQLAAVRRLTAMERYDEAIALNDTLRTRFPDTSAVTVQRGRIAQSQRHYNEAKGWYDQARKEEIVQGALPGYDGMTSAESAIDSLESRRNSYVAAGYEIDQKKGDGGISMFNARAVPLYGQYALGYDGHVFAQTDYVSADSGDLPLNGTSEFGTLPLLNVPSFRAANPGVLADYGTKRQKAHGQALMLGYENDWIRADIGHTPIGFPISYVTGGVRLFGNLGRYNYWVDASRRPMTGSMVSYAGANLPLPEVFGDGKWGGVRRDALTFHASRDFPKWGVFGEASVARLTGENVLNNTEVSARAGVDLPLIYKRDMRMNTGVTLFFDSFAQNERYYTYGHGGYYSPQTYVSLTLPLEWYGRTQRWSYYLRGSVSFSQSQEKSMPYFPTNGALQAASGDLTYGSGGGFGVGFSILGRAEYWVDRHWVIGGQIQFERSDYYAPNRFLFYMRYHFDARRGDVPMPPSPVRPIWSY
ncbi:cellulose synthase subunit BcsC-related outer membrane protein [Pandoraea faecigallinarum]|uniref:cellulose synthase subunit BcsC-related outer membrane protein n=1 Tax=Pandoraea faecigallinarum TaxID=656179 RepID=UPI0009FDC220|nr:cellulose synthase subunit BcsC-related outer membrane protein [Pandoraea faecigallinarum]